MRSVVARVRSLFGNKLFRTTWSSEPPDVQSTSDAIHLTSSPHKKHLSSSWLFLGLWTSSIVSVSGSLLSRSINQQDDSKKWMASSQHDEKGSHEALLGKSVDAPDDTARLIVFLFSWFPSYFSPEPQPVGLLTTLSDWRQNLQTSPGIEVLTLNRGKITRINNTNSTPRLITAKLKINDLNFKLLCHLDDYS